MTVGPKALELASIVGSQGQGPVARFARALCFETDRRTPVGPAHGVIKQATPNAAQNALLARGLTHEDEAETEQVFARDEVDERKDVFECARVKESSMRRFDQKGQRSTAERSRDGNRIPEILPKHRPISGGLGDDEPVVLAVSLLDRADVPVPSNGVVGRAWHDERPMAEAL